MNLSCSLSIPYPEVKVERHNKAAAVLLNNALFTSFGELNAISDYIFESIITKETDPHISDILECISMTEMNHFKTLTKMIYLLGGVNAYRPWTKNKYHIKPNYDLFEVSSMIKQNIEVEKRAIKDYQRLFAQINDKYVRRSLERIILDEEHHVELFSALIK